MRFCTSLLIAILFTLKTYPQEVILNDGYYMKDGKLFTGVYEEKDEAGLIRAAYTIKKGLLDGKTTIFNQGVLLEKRNYRKGKKHGPWEKYENSILVSEAGFLKDQKHGKWHIRDSNGILRYEMFYKRGRKVGTWKMWDEKGILVNEKKY